MAAPNMFLLLIGFEVCTNTFLTENKWQQRDLTLLLFYHVCGNFVVLLVTFFVVSQILPQNISRPKILIIPGNRASIKAGFHMIADDRESQIVDRRKFCDHVETHFCDRLRSSAILRLWSQTIAEDRTMFYLLRSSAIICDRLRSCDHMETKVLRSAIETYPIIILILTQMIQRFLATKPECSFMFVTVLSETRSSLSSVWKAPSFCLFMNIFRTQNQCFLRFWSWRCRRFRTKRRCPLCCLLRFCREHNARVHLTFLLTEMYGCSWLYDRLRSSAIIWKQLSLQSSAICDPRSSAIVCDHMETSL